MDQAPSNLRKKAAAARRAARIPTDGGSEADRHLEELAATLEQEADELERAASVPAGDNKK